MWEKNKLPWCGQKGTDPIVVPTIPTKIMSGWGELSNQLNKSEFSSATKYFIP